jgi:hypothetical protein
MVEAYERLFLAAYFRERDRPDLVEAELDGIRTIIPGFDEPLPVPAEPDGWRPR